MSNDKTVMSHDPLVGIEGGEVTADMETETVEAGNPGGDVEDLDTLVLVPSLTIADVGEYQAVLQQSLDLGGPKQIDGSEVDSIDGAGLQLLSAFVKELAQKSPVEWSGASEKLCEAAKRFGVNELLQLHKVA